MSEKKTEDQANMAEAQEHNMTNQEGLESPEGNEQESNKDASIIEKFEVLRQKLEAAQAKADENHDFALRSKAELENYRGQADREIEKAHKFALDRFVKALLPVIDTMERALEVESDGADTQAMREGVELTAKMFVDTVAKFGVEQQDPTGEVFNPDFHEAMSMVPNPDMKPNTIMQVIQKGYMLNGRVVRPARVIVVQG